MPEVNYPFMIEGRLQARAKRCFSEVLKAKREDIQANLRRAQDDRGDQLFYEQLERDLHGALSSARPAFRMMFQEVYQHGRRQFGQLFSGEFGAEPLFNEPWAFDMIETATGDLIKKLQGTASGFAENARQATEAARRGQGGTIQRANSEITKARDRAYKNAAFHVRDVAGTLYHDATFKRFEDFGVSEYEWVTRHDNRVRGRPDGLYPRAKYSHWIRHGEVYAVTHKHPDGRPGEPSACRCVAMPVWPDYKRKPKAFPAWIIAFLAGIAYGASEKEEKRPPA